MKIVVCVKHVPDGRFKIVPGSKRLDRDGPGDLNRPDRFALEEALRIKDISGSEVVAVSMGPGGAVETLRTALALGADRAVLVSDPALVGSDMLGTARVLAQIIDREAPDLVLFGQQTSDGGGALLWAAVGDLLRLPYVSQASSVTLVAGLVRIGRQTERGDEELEMTLPALVSVSDSINEPRYTSLKGRMAANKKLVEKFSLIDIGIGVSEVGEAGAATTVLSVGAMRARAGALRIVDEPDAADRIVKFLADRDLL